MERSTGKTKSGAKQRNATKIICNKFKYKNKHRKLQLKQYKYY